MVDIERIVVSPVDSNCYFIIEGARCVVIDPGDEHLPLRYLQDHGLTPEYILLTHEHCDHTAGLNVLRAQYPDALVYISDECSKGICSKRLNMSSMMEVFLYFSGKPGIKYDPFVCEPGDIIFEQGSRLEWRGHVFSFVALPGHTRGGTGIFLGDDIFFSGDYLLRDRDMDLRLPGGSEEDYLRVTRPWLEQLPDGLHIYPGHGDDYLLPGLTERFLQDASVKENI